MSHKSKLAKSIGLLILVVWPAVTSCGDDDDSAGGSSAVAGEGGEAAQGQAGGESGGASSASAGREGTLGGASGATTSGGTDNAASGAAGATVGGNTSMGGSGGEAGAAPLTERRVFVTSKTYAGTLGGLAGADAECQSLADTAHLGGTWLAWLSDSSASPASRFVHSAVPYVLVGGAQLAKDWADLIDGSLGAAINRDETGALLAADGVVSVWTGTAADGTQFGGNCMQWSSTNSGGVWGTATASDGTWSFTTGKGCQNANRLYCFEK